MAGGSARSRAEEKLSRPERGQRRSPRVGDGTTRSDLASAVRIDGRRSTARARARAGEIARRHEREGRWPSRRLGRRH